MSDKNKPTTDTTDDSERSPQVGVLLRASRIRVGEDLREVSESLCIRFLYLEAIEECRYEDLPGDTYAIGFIRSYAEHLGLDGEEVIRRYRMEQASGKRLSDLSFPTPVPESGVPKGAIVLVGVVLAVIVYGGWYATTTDDSILSDLIAPVPERLQHLVDGEKQPAGSNEAMQSPSSTSGPENSDATVQGATGVNTETQEALQANTAEAIAEATEAARDSIAETAASVADAAVETATPEAEQTAVAEEVAQTATDIAEAATAQTTLSASDASTSSDAIASTTESSVAGGTSADTVAEPEAVPVAQSTELAAPNVTAQQAEPTTESEQVSTPSQNDAPSVIAETTTEDTAPSTAEVSETSQPTVEEAPSALTPAINEVSAEDLNAQSLQAASGDAVVSSANATNPSEATPASVETASAPATETVATSSGIVIRAVDNSWVQVTDPANGEVLFTGLMSPGATFDVPSRSGLILDTGNAGAIDIIVNGNAVPKLGGEGTVRKGVTLDGARLIAGTAVN